MEYIPIATIELDHNAGRGTVLAKYDGETYRLLVEALDGELEDPGHMPVFTLEEACRDALRMWPVEIWGLETLDAWVVC
ncbi:MAG: hypothetical protein JSW58_08535 [Candidatus Latescibacterota bacterium]|nr:MAG: hypothetical protein JSW58_08535 [Candidatus Latescibacterota bacterium]